MVSDDRPTESRTMVRHALAGAMGRYIEREHMNDADSWRNCTFEELLRHLYSEIDEVKGGAGRRNKQGYELMDVMAMAAICYAKLELDIHEKMFDVSVPAPIETDEVPA